jgi:aldose 1-epimerase
MYRVETYPDSIQLLGPDGAMAEIIPGCGALLNRFSVPVQGRAVDVIDAFANAAAVPEQIKPAFQSAKLSPFVCRIRESRYRYRDVEYLLNKFALNGSAIHGLLFDEPFRLAASEAGPDEAMVELSFSYRGSDPGYPFFFDCLVRYTLHGPNLTLETEILNRDKRTLPLADGWHPYFTLGKPIDELELQFHGREMLEFENLIPTGRKVPYAHFQQFERIGATELDNAFQLDSSYISAACVLRDPSTGIQIEITPDAAYPVLQIYTPPHRRSIAIENLSGAPDNFNNGIGLIELVPGGTQSFSTMYTVREIR